MARGLIALIQSLPMRTVARCGRALGALAYYLDGRHRRVALRNLKACFQQELSPAQIRSIAREHFRRLGENYGCAIKAAGLSWAELRAHCEFIGVEKLLAHQQQGRASSLVVAVGHFGNFELYSRMGNVVPSWQCATTYRSFSPPALDRLFQSLRRRSGCLYFERRTEARALKSAMSSSRLILGLLADQHAGRSGVRVPLFNRLCSTTTAPAVFALRYSAPLHTCVCYRVGLARWQIVTGDEIPTRAGDHPRSSEDITRDINAAFEIAIRKDPANWFWVHNRWKTPRTQTRSL